MYILNKDTWQIIFDKLYFIDQINLQLVSKYFCVQHPIIQLNMTEYPSRKINFNTNRFTQLQILRGNGQKVKNILEIVIIL